MTRVLKRETVEDLLKEVNDRLWDLRRDVKKQQKEIAMLEFARTYMILILENKNPSKRSPS